MSPSFSSFYTCLTYEDKDKSAWLKVAIARAPIIIVAALFSASALTFLAELLDEDCDGRVDLGFITLRISSVLAAEQVIENVLTALMLPVFGAIADTTPHRKLLLVLTSIIWSAAVGVGGVVLLFEPSLKLLYIFFITGVIATVFYEPAFILLFAYLPEIGKTDEECTELATKQASLVYGIQLGFAIALTGISLALSGVFDTDLPLTSIAHFSFIIWFCCFAIQGLYHLPKRNQHLSQESKVSVFASLKNMIHSLIYMYKHYHQLFLFLIAWMFYYSAATQITILQLTYLIEEFDYQTSDIGILGAIVLIFATVGASLSQILPNYFKLEDILVSVVLGYAIGSVAFPLLLQGEVIQPSNVTDETAAGCVLEDQISRQPNALASVLVYVFAVFNGIGTGLIFSISPAIYALIIPGGEEATYYAFKAFFSKLLTWAPSLVFGAVNETTENIQLAFSSICFFFLLSLPFLFSFQFKLAQSQIKHTIHLRETRDSTEHTT